MVLGAGTLAILAGGHDAKSDYVRLAWRGLGRTYLQEADRHEG
jgi:hypothetical protein